jgi:hypothetical protein
MAIHGTLRRNPLSAILQKLSHADATGQLQVLNDAEGGRKLRIDFRRGNIVFVKSGLRPPDMRLGQLVIRGGYATEEDVWECLSIAEETKRPLGSVMIEDEFIDHDVLGELLGVQFLEDIVFSLGWKQGDFRFVEEPPTARDAEPALSPQDFLAQALRYSEKKKVFDALIPTNDTIFGRAVASPLPEGDIVANKLTIEDVALFDVLDGTLTVNHLLPVMREPMFEVAQTIRRLSDAGLIKRVMDGGATQTRVQVRRLSFQQALVFHGLTTFVVASALALFVGVFLTYRGASQEAEWLRPYDARKTALTRAQIQRLTHGLEAYQVANGVYPASLDILVEQGILVADDLSFPGYTGRYVYHPSGDTFILVRPKK